MLAKDKELAALKDKEVSKILVISDSHGYRENLEKALELYGRECDALIFLGDGIQELIEIIEENSHIPQDISMIPPVVAIVRGNGDDPAYSLYTSELTSIQIPDQDSLVISGQKFFFTHGHQFGVYYSRDHLFSFLEENRFDCGLFGHTHVPYQERRDNILILNPGSCSAPRNHSDKSCVVLTVTKKTAEADEDFEPIKYRFYSLQ